MINLIRRTIIVTSFLFLSACETVPEKTVQQTPEAQPKVVKPKVVSLSAQAIKNPPKEDVFFAQTALKGLGYSIGQVDGIWGKRSSSSMISFEKNNYLESANGYLSDLNLETLKSQHGPVDIKTTKKATDTIASKLRNKTPNRNAPELIITERNYSLMSKANPYSKTIANIEPGAGIYVLSFQNGWYEIETLSKLNGFIRDN